MKYVKYKITGNISEVPDNHFSLNDKDYIVLEETKEPVIPTKEKKSRNKE